MFSNHDFNQQPLLKWLLCLALFSTHPVSASSQNLLIELNPDHEISATHYPAQGEYLLLWLAPEYGFRPAHVSLFERLAKINHEIVAVDLAESFFLPYSSSSLRQFDGSLVAKLIEYLAHKSGKKILLAGDAYAAINVLRGVHRWQAMTATKADVIGVLLFSPNTFATIPPLGLPPEYIPEIEATNIPAMIFQATGNSNFVQFDHLLSKLRQYGAPVYVHKMRSIANLFYDEDPDAAMKSAAKPIPRLIQQIIPLLQRYPVSRQAIELKKSPQTKGGIDIYLKPFKGNSTPPFLSLNDISGALINKQDYLGKVTLVNFWASWCPPCVEEIPSLNQLQQSMRDFPFELISINYAESPSQVRDFLKQVNVEFPVLMDIDGSVAKTWQVITYPSTFVIGPDGLIKYGVNAAIDWNDPDLIDTLKNLLDNTH